MRFPRARSLHRLAAIDLRPAPALLPVKREKEEEEEGTRRHTHTRAWHPLSEKEGALGSRAVRAALKFVAPAKSAALRRRLRATCLFLEYSTILRRYNVVFYCKRIIF